MSVSCISVVLSKDNYCFILMAWLVPDADGSWQWDRSEKKAFTVGLFKDFKSGIIHIEMFSFELLETCCDLALIWSAFCFILFIVQKKTQQRLLYLISAPGQAPPGRGLQNEWVAAWQRPGIAALRKCM